MPAVQNSTDSAPQPNKSKATIPTFSRNEEGREDDDLPVWKKLTSVESTALKVNLYRVRAAARFAGGCPYDVTYDKLILDTHLTQDQQEQLEAGNEGILYNIMGVRTAELDYQLGLLMQQPGSRPKQLVILGAGLDTRAWRLTWPSGFKVFEVDTGTSEQLKTEALSKLPLTCTRKFVKANLSDLVGLQAGLTSAGFSSADSVVWLLEGLVGYLTAKECTSLFEWMYANSPVGSAVVLTCPPSPIAKVLAAAAGYTLYHATFEEPELTFRRLKRSGWTGQLNSAASINKKYQLKPFYQAQIVARKETPQPSTTASSLHKATARILELPADAVRGTTHTIYTCLAIAIKADRAYPSLKVGLAVGAAVGIALVLALKKGRA